MLIHQTEARPRSHAVERTSRLLTPAPAARPWVEWRRSLSPSSSSSSAHSRRLPLAAAAAAEEQQRLPQQEAEGKQEEEEEEDLSKRRLGRVEAAGILDGLIEALRIQQVRVARETD